MYFFGFLLGCFGALYSFFTNDFREALWAMTSAVLALQISFLRDEI